MCNKQRDQEGEERYWLQRTTLTALVAGLSEGLPLGENDGHGQILEGRDVEEGGVLVVLDVLVVNIGLIARRTGNVAGTSRGEGGVMERDGKKKQIVIHRPGWFL